MVINDTKMSISHARILPYREVVKRELDFVFPVNMRIWRRTLAYLEALVRVLLRNALFGKATMQLSRFSYEI